MNDRKKLVEALRDIEKTMFMLGTSPININDVSINIAYDKRWGRTAADAADAIEELQAEVKILKVSGREAYFEGMAADAEPKLGKWVRVENEESYHYECSRCGERPLYSRYGDVVLSGVCPMCGAKMEVQDGQE